MGWSLDIMDMSWVEHTSEEVDFILEALELRGGERILDLACGFGRHCLELARRGYRVVGVDYTAEFIDYARRTAAQESLEAEFVCSDVRDVRYCEEFDAVLNMADGAIGYFATDEENLRLFDVIARALRRGGRHVMGVCSADYAMRHFPQRAWEAGNRSLSLADFLWDTGSLRMIYQSHVFRFGEVLERFDNVFPEDGSKGIRLYTLAELEGILRAHGMSILAAYGGYDTSIPASADRLMSVVCSVKG